MSAQERFERLATLPMRSFTPERRGVTSMWKQVSEVIDHRQLLWLLTRRDLQVRYRGSVLGFLWTLIKPLILLATYYVILGQVLGAARGIENFGIYVFSGLTIYMLFSESLGAAAGSIVGNGGLVKKIYLPREIFPLAAIGGAIFMFSMQLLVLVGAVVIGGEWPPAQGLLYFFPSVLLILVYVTGIGLLLSALNVYLRDVQYITEILLTLMMWGSPIVYSWQMVRGVLDRFQLPAWLLEVYTNNPLTLAVLGFHRSLWSGGTEADYPTDLALRMGIAGVIGVIFLLCAHWAFQRMQSNLAQEL
ncbi:ABC transporter permease [Microbacterium sp. SORGH_AS_0421]|uniref:ABC transporter permease n=1 Tax=Microbacterium sp. SORGH_AS_0421 TaxID=3041768 RepID=UPI002790BDDF|nr:ABC transporter permease [Microbacterium sp. SORGH_AS_0421]MDQ1177120.1 ABC-2 type transport system permease protein [Microbacterium sp. SORGH_AS_0421]